MSDPDNGDGRAPSLAIVVPVYNEAGTIERGVREIAAEAERHPGDVLVIAVDDGSADGSAAVLERLQTEIEPLDVQRHSRNAGYGAALRTGAGRAAALGFDYVAFIDSDLTNPPADLLRIGELARAGHEYIKASRFVPGGRMEGVPAWRRALSVAGNQVGRVLFGGGVRDVTNGFRAVRTELVVSWPLRESGFAVIVEELDWALRSGLEPVEFPTVLRSRTSDQRPSAFVPGPRLLMSYLRYAIRAFARRLGRPMQRQH